LHIISEYIVVWTSDSMFTLPSNVGPRCACVWCSKGQRKGHWPYILHPCHENQMLVVNGVLLLLAAFVAYGRFAA